MTRGRPAGKPAGRQTQEKEGCKDVTRGWADPTWCTTEPRDRPVTAAGAQAEANMARGSPCRRTGENQETLQRAEPSTRDNLAHVGEHRRALSPGWGHQLALFWSPSQPPVSGPSWAQSPSPQQRAAPGPTGAVAAGHGAQEEHRAAPSRGLTIVHARDTDSRSKAPSPADTANPTWLVL